MLNHAFTVSMVTNYVKKMTMTCLIMIRHVFDTSFVVSSDKGWSFSSVRRQVKERLETGASHLKYLNNMTNAPFHQQNMFN